MLWQSFWLDLCTKEVVSARVCANLFLPNSSSGIALFGMRTVQADSCSNSEQIETLFISGGGQEGGWGGGGAFWAGGPEFTRACQDFILTLPALTVESRRLAQNIISHFTAYIKFTLAGPGQNLTYPL